MEDPNPGAGVSHWELTLLVRDLRLRVRQLEERSREQDQLIANLIMVNSRINSENDKLRPDYAHPMGNEQQLEPLSRAASGEPVLSWQLKERQLIIPEIAPVKGPHTIWDRLGKKDDEDE